MQNLDFVTKRDSALPALTGLRFVAALAVVISHFYSRGLIDIPASVFNFLDGGRTAVSLFFVLSGFILAYNYTELSDNSAQLRFYINRVARIYPLVLLSLFLASVGVGYAWIHREEGYLEDWYTLVDNPGAFLGLSFVAQLTMTTGWLPIADLNQPWNGPAWSISCEMFFYLLFPFLIVRMRKASEKNIALTLAIAYALQGAIILAVRTFLPSRGGLISQFPVTHLFEFILGIAAALWFLRGGREWIAIGQRRGVAVVGSIVALAALAALRPVDPAYFLMTPLFAVLVVALSIPPKHVSLLGQRAIVRLGEASFALYLIHIPFMHAVHALTPRSAVAGWLLILVTILLSVAIFMKFETPARVSVRNRLYRMTNQG